MAKYYNDYDFFNITNECEGFENLYIINHFETFQQSTEETCASCCVIMLLNYLEGGGFRVYKKSDEISLAKALKTKKFPCGTNLENIVDFLKNDKIIAKKYDVVSSLDYKKDDNGFCFSNFKEFKNFVISSLKEKYPIIVENVDYGGHYKIIIGYDCVNENFEDDVLIFADSADFGDANKDGYSIYPAERFFFMWFDDHCLSANAKKQPFVLLKRKN